MNAVLRISQTTGTVLWKIGGYTDTNHDGAIHFSVLGDPLGTFNLAHDVRLIPGGHLTMFDNRASAATAGRMRAVEYAIDATAHTITFVWQRPIDGPVHQRRLQVVRPGQRAPPARRQHGHRLGRRALPGVQRGRPGGHVPARRLAARRPASPTAW